MWIATSLGWGDERSPAAVRWNPDQFGAAGEATLFASRLRGGAERDNTITAWRPRRRAPSRGSGCELNRLAACRANLVQMSAIPRPRDERDPLTIR